MVEQILAKNNVTAFNGPQGRILTVLWEKDHIPIQEISVKTGLAKATLTKMLDTMEQKGLLNRQFDSEDRRKILICLTEEASELRKQYSQVSEQMSEIFYAGFAEEEIVLFEKTLKRILNNLEENCRK